MNNNCIYLYIYICIVNFKKLCLDALKCLNLINKFLLNSYLSTVQEDSPSSQANQDDQVHQLGKH